MEEILELMKKRHSVRQYKDIQIEEEKRKILNELIERINSETGLKIQIFYDEPNCFDSIKAHYGKFRGVKNYISLVGQDSKDLDIKLGYYGEEIALKAQKLGLNTCWVALTHGKSKATIQKGEKEVCVISLGYGLVDGMAHKSKKVSEISNYNETMPDWFLKGVEAAILAPTAMNQQKFYFELLPDEKVKLIKGIGPYTKLDLGIAKYHFEIATNKEVEI